MNKRNKKKLEKRNYHRTYKAWRKECEEWIKKYTEEIEKLKKPKTEEEERLNKVFDEMFPLR